MLQWDHSRHSGFTSGLPWMRVNDDYVEWNAEAQKSDKSSVLNFWKRALEFRKANEVLVCVDPFTQMLVVTCSTMSRSTAISTCWMPRTTSPSDLCALYTTWRRASPPLRS